MRLDAIMSRPILSIDATATAREAWQIMKVNQVHHLAVRMDGRVIGVLSHHDLRTAPLAVERVAELMSGPIVTATPHTTVRQAANLLRGRATGCLLVVSKGRPIGIVTVSDLLELLGKGAERPVERGKRWTLRHRGPRKRVRA